MSEPQHGVAQRRCNRRKKRTVSRGLSAILLMAALTGCTKSRDGFVYRPVSGTVLLDGQPIEGVAVAFVPIAATLQVGRPSIGTTDAAGRFELTSIDGLKGAVVGEHVVSLSTGEVDPLTQSVIRPESISPRYNAQSELRFTVPLEGDVDAEFRISSR